MTIALFAELFCTSEYLVTSSSKSLEQDSQWTNFHKNAHAEGRLDRQSFEVPKLLIGITSVADAGDRSRRRLRQTHSLETNGEALHFRAPLVTDLTFSETKFREYVYAL